MDFSIAPFSREHCFLQQLEGLEGYYFRNEAVQQMPGVIEDGVGHEVSDVREHPIPCVTCLLNSVASEHSN